MEPVFFSHVAGTETSRGYKYSAITGYKDPVSGYIFASEKEIFVTPESAEAYVKAQAKKKLKVETVSGVEVARHTDNPKTKSITVYSLGTEGGKS